MLLLASLTLGGMVVKAGGGWWMVVRDGGRWVDGVLVGVGVGLGARCSRLISSEPQTVYFRRIRSLLFWRHTHVI